MDIPSLGCESLTMRRFRRIADLTTLLVAVPLTAQAQPRAQVISGRVTTDSGAAIAAADVIVTIAPTTESITGKSDSTGNYRIVIPNPTGEYLLYISALGRRALISACPGTRHPSSSCRTRRRNRTRGRLSIGSICRLPDRDVVLPIPPGS